MKSFKNNKINFKTNIFYLLILFVMISIIKDPALSIDSAKNGILIWFNVLLPSLLPFFILSELLILSGFVKTFGNLLKPVMKPLFNVSGEGSFPVIMSMVSGYPVGSKLTCSLRNKNIITKLEGDRLITFSSTSGPLFILGAVLVGMLNSPHLKFLMIAPHYLGSLTLGFLFSFYNPEQKRLKQNQSNIYIENKINKENNQPLGYIISKSVKDGMNSIILVGGFVILYSVIIEVFLNSHLIKIFIISLSRSLNISVEILVGVFAGIFEISIGAQKIAALDLNVFYKICIINFIIAWGGFSGQSQALSFISQTDINSKIFVIGKFFHGAFSAIYTYIFYLLKYKNTIIPSTSFPSIIQKGYDFNNWISTFVESTKLSMAVCLYFLVLSLFIHLIFLQKKEA
ncbi:sporulation integral membrane protein YlbJ [Tissierella creatinophila]|uniref:Sporulation integral membrane protein YlbJ n=1 Tax=Tissierella creatinophila DSM 6911 TaxID=1123403 RepID=A0A1U7M372_TISCR|nr:sporulation integral membrane protein YlbJ [Tissierella creatinophila]OLS01725.1 sporulation integral membrane protein YlbJ [Tissierella creatinophila DSM 6911]